MDTNINSTAAPKGIEVNVLFLMEKVIKKWWLLLISTVVVAAIGWGCAYATTTPTYTSNLSFTVYNKEATDVNSSGDINSSIMMANTFKYILEGRTMCARVAEVCGYDITPAQVADCMRVDIQSNTNIIIVKVTTTSPEKSYALAAGIANCYSEIVDYAYPNARLQIYEEPFTPTAPDTQTSYTLYTIVGGVVGFALAFIAVLIANAAHDTIQSADDITLKLDVNVIGSIDNVKNKKKKNRQKRLLITDRTLGFSFIEGYKVIRTKIETYCKRNDHKVIMVTSANENEGKTTVAINLALSLAQNGNSVLVIDADMRKPSICKFLNLTVNPDCDLANVISGKTELSDSIKYVEKHKLFILATVQANDEPTEMLSSQQMNKLIKAAREEFDYVIVDTAPSSVVADANILTNFSDAVVLVIREDFAASGRIRGVIDDLSSNKAELIGCVFNGATVNGVRGAYSKYKYGYGYGYGYGYEPNHSEGSKENT